MLLYMRSCYKEMVTLSPSNSLWKLGKAGLDQSKNRKLKCISDTQWDVIILRQVHTMQQLKNKYEFGSEVVRERWKNAFHFTLFSFFYLFSLSNTIKRIIPREIVFGQFSPFLLFPPTRHSTYKMVWPVFLLTIIIPSVVAIYNGTTVTDPTIYPFFVMLGNPHVCGGVIISYNPPIVLTAAHCVADAHHPSTLPLGASNPYFAGFRGTDRRKHKINRIVDWVIHPSYMDVRGEIDMHYDIALIKLHVPIEPSSSVSRVALWPEQEELINPRQGVLMGFGYLGTADQDQANILQQMVLDVSRFSLASQEMIEAVTPLDFGWACHGDSGNV